MSCVTCTILWCKAKLEDTSSRRKQAFSMNSPVAIIQASALLWMQALVTRRNIWCIDVDRWCGSWRETNSIHSARQAPTILRSPACARCISTYYEAASPFQLGVHSTTVFIHQLGSLIFQLHLLHSLPYLEMCKKQSPQMEAMFEAAQVLRGLRQFKSCFPSCEFCYARIQSTLGASLVRINAASTRGVGCWGATCDLLASYILLLNNFSCQHFTAAIL